MNSLFKYTLRVSQVTRQVFLCWAEEAWREIKNSMATLVNSLTSIFLAWISFFNVFLNFFKYLYTWGLLQCQTFQYRSPPNGVITSSVLWIKYNLREDVRVSVCSSQLCFPFFSLKKQLLYWTPFWNRHPRKRRKNIETSPSHSETLSKNRLRFCLNINLEMDHPSKTIYPSVSTSWRRANRRISLRRIFLYNSSSYRIYT